MEKLFQPQIGLFFFIKGVVYGWGEPLPKQINQEFTDIEMNHFDYFNELVEDLPELHLSFLDDYGEFPRGRVIYQKSNQTFLIYADFCLIKNESSKKKIIKEFNLNQEKVIWKSDEHYTCAFCNPEIKKNIEIMNRYIK